MNAADKNNKLTEEDIDMVLEELSNLLFDKWLAEMNSVGNMKTNDENELG